MTKWAGVFPYLPTPRKADGGMDEVSLGAIAQEAISHGVHGLTPLGSSGEIVLLSVEDRLRAVEVVVEAADGRVPVVSGVAGYSPVAICEEVKAAEGAGANGILLIVLGYYKLSTSEILHIIERVVNTTSLPVVIYNHPKLTNVDVTPEVMKEAYCELNVTYMKDSSGSIGRLDEYCDIGGGKLRIFSATAISPVVAMQHGAVGWMSGPASIYSRESAEIFELASRGRWDDAFTVERKLNPALDVFRQLGPARGIKALFAAKGRSVGDPFPPLDGLSGEDLDMVRKLID